VIPRHTASEADDGSGVVVELAIDDRGLARRVRTMLLKHPDLRIADAEDGFSPEVRITDGEAGSAADVAVVVITGRSGALAALRAGAAAVLSEHTDGAALAASIRAAARGLTILSGDYRDLFVDDAQASGGLERDGDADPAAVDLTQREQQVLQLLAQGASNKTIARRLEITPHTAKFHVASIIAKLGATGRTDAVAKAMRLGLVMI
jgi:DNA-binding NarL/FixJ family response regulator